jgi:hypothetical protein
VESTYFQTFLRQVRRRWRGWRIVIFLDRGSPHRAQASQQLAEALGLELRWLPTACPELNPVDHLWRHLKQAVCANAGLRPIEDTLRAALAYRGQLSPAACRHKAGLRAPTCWLRRLV